MYFRSSFGRTEIKNSAVKFHVLVSHKISEISIPKFFCIFLKTESHWKVLPVIRINFFSLLMFGRLYIQNLEILRMCLYLPRAFDLFAVFASHESIVAESLPDGWQKIFIVLYAVFFLLFTLKQMDRKHFYYSNILTFTILCVFARFLEYLILIMVPGVIRVFNMTY